MIREDISEWFRKILYSDYSRKKAATKKQTKKKKSLTIGDVMREKHVTLQFRRNLKSLIPLILHFIEV